MATGTHIITGRTVGDANIDTSSALARATGLSAIGQAAVKVMHAGDSLPGSGGYAAANGGPRIAFYERLLSKGGNVRAVGEIVNLFPSGGSGPLTDVRCACYAGTTIEQHGNGSTGKWDAGGATRVYVQASALNMPDILFMMIGTNNASVGDSSATMISKYTTMIGVIRAVAPNMRIVGCTIPLEYSPAAPTGGLAACNANIAAFNAWLLATAPGLFGSLFSAIDTCGSLTAADAYTDGIHLLYRGQASIGRIQAIEHERIWPFQVGLQIPRLMTLRPSQANVMFAANSDQMTAASNSNVRHPAGSFLAGIDIIPKDMIAAGGTTTIFQCGAYATGFLVFLNNASNEIDVSINGVTVSNFTQPTWVNGQRYRLWVLCDFANLLISVWLGLPSLNGSPNGTGTPMLTCLGIVACSTWTQGAATPTLYIGKTPEFANGCIFGWNNFEFYTGSSVPSTSFARDALAANYYEGSPACAGRTEFYQGSEGSGTSVASSAGGPAGTLTSALWAQKGQFPAAWDQDSPGGYMEPRQYALADDVGMGATATINKAFAAGAAGTADDVSIFVANAPFKFRVLDSFVRVSTLIGASTLQLRDTAGGAGTALSSAMSSAATGRVDDAGTASGTVAKNGSLYLRRSDRGVAGEVTVIIQRVA